MSGGTDQWITDTILSGTRVFAVMYNEVRRSDEFRMARINHAISEGHYHVPVSPYFPLNVEKDAQ